MTRKKIAIACQGGGSQTAFTAGVLKSFFESGVPEKKQIVSLSGTSGGAICAALSWYSILKAQNGDKTPIEERLMAFWRDNSARHPMEEIFNDSMIESLELIESGLMPEWNSSPGSPFSKFMAKACEAWFPRNTFYDFKALIEKHIDFFPREQVAGVQCTGQGIPGENQTEAM